MSISSSCEKAMCANSNLRNSLCMTCVWLVGFWVVWVFCLFVCFIFDNLEGQMVTSSCYIPQLSTLSFQFFDSFPPKPWALSPYSTDLAGINSQIRSGKWFGTVGVWFLDFCRLFYNKWKAFIPQKNVMLLNIGRNLSFKYWKKFIFCWWGG